MGWSDWIIQPQGFEAGFCRGSCARLTHQNSGKIYGNKYYPLRVSTKKSDFCVKLMKSVHHILCRGCSKQSEILTICKGHLFPGAFCRYRYPKQIWQNLKCSIRFQFLSLKKKKEKQIITAMPEFSNLALWWKSRPQYY